MKFLLLLLFVTSVYAMDGDEENKVQEEAMIIQMDYGKDSPELDAYLQEKQLTEEDLDSFSDEDE